MPTVHDYLRKIQYIEADIEIQKQILFSLASSQTEEIEKTIRLLAEHKAEIEALREKIREIDPQEFERIRLFEQVVNDFKEMAQKKKFLYTTGAGNGQPCQLSLRSGPPIDCLVKAYDDQGEWTVITTSGEVRCYKGQEVAEAAPEIFSPIITEN